MKFWRVVFTILVVSSFVSCDKEDADCNSMVWKAEMPVHTEDGRYVVSGKGETLTFVCENYSNIWFEKAVEREKEITPSYTHSNYDNPEYPTLWGEHFCATIIDNKLSVIFFKHDGFPAIATDITVSAGDVVYTFKFLQLTH